MLTTCKYIYMRNVTLILCLRRYQIGYYAHTHTPCSLCLCSLCCCCSSCSWWGRLTSWMWARGRKTRRPGWPGIYMYNIEYAEKSLQAQWEKKKPRSSISLHMFTICFNNRIVDTNSVVYQIIYTSSSQYFIVWSKNLIIGYFVLAAYLLRFARHQSYGDSLTSLEVLYRNGELNPLLLWLTSLLPGAASVSRSPAITAATSTVVIVPSCTSHSGDKDRRLLWCALFRKGALYLD